MYLKSNKMLNYLYFLAQNILEEVLICDYLGGIL